MQKQGGIKYLSFPVGGPLISRYKQRGRLEVALVPEEREHKKGDLLHCIKDTRTEDILSLFVVFNAIRYLGLMRGSVQKTEKILQKFILASYVTLFLFLLLNWNPLIVSCLSSGPPFFYNVLNCSQEQLS